MKKILKIVFVGVVFSLCFMVSAFAEDDYYTEQYKNSGIQSLEELVPNDAKDLLDQFDIDVSNPNFIQDISAKNIFSHILQFLKSGLKDCKGAFVSLMFICIFSAAANLFCNNEMGLNSVNYISALCICTVVLVPLFSHINTVIKAIKAASVFMLSFVPVFSAINIASTAKVGSVGSSATLLFAAEIVSVLASFVILPLLSGYLSVGICTSVCSMPMAQNLCKTAKKIMLYIMSFAFCVFTGVIGIQSTVNAAADTLGTKTAKFMLNSSVPMVGSVLSESLGTVLASAKLLRSTAAVYAVIALSAIFLPILLQTLIWQLVVKAAGLVSNMFAQNGTEKILTPIGDALTLTSGIILFVFALFVISLSVITIVMGGSGV